MPPYVRLPPPHRRIQPRLTVNRPTIVARPTIRSDIALPAQARPPIPAVVPSAPADQLNPYVDYQRMLTPEGGVLFIYKDLDLRFRHTLWRLFAWSVSTGIEARHLLTHSPLHQLWLNIVLVIAIALVNWWIVAKPVEIHRSVEVRIDCLILEGTDVFWRYYMDGGFPAFRPDSEGNSVLCGIYGTRYVEYLTARRFDEHDRTPDVFAVHFEAALYQLWTRHF